jgi:uncharacterized protein (DUF58 family)
MQQYPEPPSNDEPVYPPAQGSPTPLTLRELYESGLAWLGSALLLGLLTGGGAWLVLAASIVFVMLLATLEAGGWTSRRPISPHDEPRRLPEDDYRPLKLVIRPHPDRPSGDEPR